MENTAITKRKFLGFLAAAPAALAVFKLSGGIATPAYAASPEAAASVTGPFTLPDLPYRPGALYKAIDNKTMGIHYGRHHKAYVDNLNKEVEKNEKLQGKSLEQIVERAHDYPAAVRNNAGGHWNHSFFWEIMTPSKSEMSPELKAAIDEAFGSEDAFKEAFAEAGGKQFGSGWVWLIVNKDGKLEITTTANQDNPLMNGAKVKGTPILGNDVWEHAYYLQYQNRRADYLKAWWQVVNWTKVSEHYAAAIA